MLSFEDALDRLLSAAKPVQETRVLPLEATAGRVLAEPLQAAVASPPADNSAKDGYAVRLADLKPNICLPVSQRIPAGKVGVPLQPGTVARIFTGAPIPAGADAVIMQENCEATDAGVVIRQGASLGENIRRAGEDITAGAQILAAGTRLGARDVALAASAGVAQAPVYRRLRVAVFFTGDELRQPGEPLPPGAIYNSNRFALRALLEGLNCEVRDLGQVPDNLEATREALRRAAGDNDLIVTSGGVSVGEEDHVKPAVEAEGRLDLWKIAIKPGKPLAFGEVFSDGSHGKARTWFVGLPGNPVSSFVTFLLLVRPFVLRLQGVEDVLPRQYPLRAGFEWTTPSSLCEFLRAGVGPEGEVELFGNQGSGVISSLCWGDGLVVKAPDRLISPGDIVPFIPFSELLS